MPRGILGIPGANPVNYLLFVICLAWLSQRKSEGLTWDMPGNIRIFFLVNWGIFILAFFRLLMDKDGFEEFYLVQSLEIQSFRFGISELWNAYFISLVKWIVPALLLFDGCRSKKRFLEGVVAILAMNLLMSLMIIKYMPLSAITNVEKLTQGALKLDKWIGYHRVDLSMMLAGAGWATISLLSLVKKINLRLLLLGSSAIMLFGQVLTGGRGGYLAWVCIGMTLGILRWRKIVFCLPLMLLVITLAIPQVRNRVYTGMQPDNFGQTVVDVDALSAGRIKIWEFVLHEIKESPVVGYGRLAIIRTGTSWRCLEEEGEFFGHTHNAYLEYLMDNGLIGLFFLLAFYFVLIKYSIILLRSENQLFVAAGGVSLSFLIAQLVTSLTAQTFYPRESGVPMWCAVGLMLRVYVERLKIIKRDMGKNSQEQEISWVEMV